MEHPMKRRDFLRSAGAGVCLAAASYSIASMNPSAKRPNIIICTADDQGWGDMAYNCHPLLKTPNFDEMAAEGVRFDRFYAAAPVCSPTRASILTGRHPNRMGCFKWGHTLRPQEITIAEALKTAGYVTGHFGKWHVGPVERGSPVNPGASGFDEWFSAPNFFDMDPILSREGIAVQNEGESSDITVDAAIEFIKKHSQSNQPFLAVVWFGSPHNPHEASEEDRALYPGQTEEMQHFLGEITAMDRAFGRLRQELRDQGIHENTILWYSSDNGGLPKLGSTGGRGFKGQVYEGGLRIPAILEWPAQISNPKRIEIPCNTSDIYPTLLEIVGVELENQPPLDGISLVPLFRDEMPERAKPMGFWDHPTRGVITPSGQLMDDLMKAQRSGQTISSIANLRLESTEISTRYPEDEYPGHSAWLAWPWKLHRIQGQDEDVKLELYRLEDDPQEKQDLSEKHQDRVAAMKAELEEWLASVARSLNGKDYVMKESVR